MSSEKDDKELISDVKNHNYINILKNENSELDNKLKKVNELVSKLKEQIMQNEQEKNQLIATSNQKDKDLELFKKQLEETKLYLNELKSKNKLSTLIEENNNNLNSAQKKDSITNNTAELQQKITDLEFKLKASSSAVNNKNYKYFSSLSGTHGCSLEIYGRQQKKSEDFPNLFDMKIFDKKMNNNDFFLTGRNEMLEMKEDNIKLKEQIEVLKNELNKYEDDKTNMMKELEQCDKEKNNLLKDIKEKNEEINQKINKENELNSNLIRQLIENKKILNILDNIKIKLLNLEKNKKELEDVIFKQESKVSKLSSSVQKILNVVKLKDIEINNNKIYINNLEETIKDLNKEFQIIRLNKKKNNSEDILNLKKQLENLIKEYQKIIKKNNNNIGIKRLIINHNHFSKKNFLSRNVNISKNINESNRKKIQFMIKNGNGTNFSVINRSIIGKHGKSNGAEKHSYELFNEKNNYSNIRSPYFEYNENSKNIIKKIQLQKYKNSINGHPKLNRLKNSYGNSSVGSFLSINNNIKKIYKLKGEKYTKNKSEDKYLYDYSYRKRSDVFKKSQYYNNNINKSSYLTQRQINFEKDVKIEKQKIEEFKHLLNDIVHKFEN